MALENDGVPSVAVHTQSFVRLARAVARTNGMPTTRQAFVPQPVVGRTRAELRAYIEGEDPDSRQPFARELIEGLTKPLTDEDLSGLSFTRDTPRLLDPGDEDDLQQLFVDNSWTDGLPVILPTEKRVQAMLGGTSYSPDEVVGRMSPTLFREKWEFTVEKVAVNAVMAGARPEYFPVILALAASGRSARGSSTSSHASIAFVNGPVRKEIGMNTGIGALGPWSHPNMTIGRAYGLLSQNLQGGSVPGESYMGSQGNPLSTSLVFPENEEDSPFEPFHVANGWDRDASTIWIGYGGFYKITGTGPRDNWEERFRHCLEACDPTEAPVLILDPLAAKEFSYRGYDRRKIQEWMAANSLVRARDYWDNLWSQVSLRPLGVSGVEPYASHLKADPDDLVQMFPADDVIVVVTGGSTQPVWKMIGAMGGMSMGGAGLCSIDDWR